MNLNFLSAIALCLTFALIYFMTKISPITLIKDFILFCQRNILRKSSEKYYKNKDKFAKMTEKERKKNKSYKFYLFINEIILDLGWKIKGITVEGITFSIATITTVLSILFYITLKNILLTIIMFFITFCILIALLFLFSRNNHTIRKIALMDAEDAISASISQGVVTSIEDNIASFDVVVQPIFKQFLDEIYNQNADVYTALTHLNENCGIQYDAFCNTAKIFERERKPGMENAFQNNIKNNANVRKLDKECLKSFSALNNDFFVSHGIIFAALIGSMFFDKKIFAFYCSPWGKIVLTFIIALASFTFIYCQYIQTKPFSYGNAFEKANKKKKGNVDFAIQNQKTFEMLYNVSKLTGSKKIYKRKSKKGSEF